MKFQQKMANWMFRHMSFPNGCQSGAKFNWMLKDNCPVCMDTPIETLSNAEYHKKYPANNRIILGKATIYLCNTHLGELREELNNVIER